MNAEGRCLCSAVTFVAEGVAAELHVCHCSMCRRWAGGPTFSTDVGSVTFSGEENIQRYDSSTWAERGFCKRCGSSRRVVPLDVLLATERDVSYFRRESRSTCPSSAH